VTQYAMVVDLQKCTGCGACSFACKIENNVPNGMYHSHYIKGLTGKFPNVKYSFIPTLCNHCSNAACVAACPVDPKVMHKDENGMTLHDVARCIGCRSCEKACPYGVISFNGEEPHQFWRDELGQAVTKKVGGKVIPNYNPDRELSVCNEGIRRKKVVEKCFFCDHRVTNEENPYCVDACPAKARVFGDLDDPNSEASKLLRNNKSMRLKEEAGTEPNVYYIGEFNPK